jgi:hypothetical protein
VDGKYLSVAHFPNAPTFNGLKGRKVDQGLLQVLVVWPKHQGLIAPASVAALVEAHFPCGLALISGTTRVKITAAPWTAQPLIESDRASLPVTIPWTA